jgi:hypothetical protein
MTTTFDLNRTGILRNAFQMAGVVAPGADPDSSQLAMGGDILNTQIKALQAEGIILTTVALTTVALTAGTGNYTLAASVLDVDTKRPYVSNGSINVPLEWYSRAMYMELTVPTINSQPTSIWVEEVAPIVVHLYPVPDSNWTSLVLPTISLLPDLTAGTDGSTLRSKYLRTLVLGVARDLVVSFGTQLDRFEMLDKMYQEAKSIATNDDTERGSVRFIPDYGSFGGRYRI